MSLRASDSESRLTETTDRLLEVNPEPVNRRAWLAATLIPFAVIVAAVASRAPDFSDDGQAYLAMARGHTELVPKPFSNRIVLPGLVKVIAYAAGLSTETGFLIVGIISLLTILGILSQLMLRGAWGRADIVAALLVAPCLGLFYLFGSMPDLLVATLMAAMIALIAADQWMAALPILIVAQCARESTILFAAVWIVCLALRRQFVRVIGAAAAIAVGMLIVAMATRGNRGNIHEMNSGLYLLLKVPFNACQNFFGLLLWTDTLPGRNPNGPVWTMPLPSWIHIGAIHRVGIDMFLPMAIISTGTFYLSTFGIGPAVLLAAGVRRGVKHGPVWLQLCLAYGAISFITAPMLGSGVQRLMAGGWPLFILAAPAILHANRVVHRLAAMTLLLVHLVAQWLNEGFGLWWPARGLGARALILFVFLTVQIWAWKFVKGLPCRSQSLDRGES